MKRSGRITRTAPLPRSAIKRKPRKPSETLRVYGPPSRRAWVKSLPCVVPWCFRVDIENAHTESGGTSRKANYETIVPACHAHHRELHQHGIRSFEARYDVDLKLAAIATEQQWLAHCARA